MIRLIQSLRTIRFPSCTGARSVSHLGSCLSRSRIALAFAVAVITVVSQRSYAAGDSCGVQAAVQSFTSSASAALAVLPVLDGDVDKCFNPSRPSYIQQTHRTLGSIAAQYQQSVQQLHNSVQNGRAGDFSTEVGQIVSNIQRVSQPIFDQASNLRRYGFVTSDAKDGDQYRYPQCNSRNNDRPEENWNRFYSAVDALRLAGGALSSAAECVTRTGG